MSFKIVFGLYLLALVTISTAERYLDDENEYLKRNIDNPLPDAIACSRLTCSSWGYAYANCDAPGRVMSVTLKRKVSGSPCTLGTSFGKSGNKIWVDKGCRAEFEVCVARYHQLLLSSCSSLRCSSWGYKYATCDVPGHVMSVSMTKKYSNSACIRGKSFGELGQKIWVDKGCRAKFEVCVSRYPTKFASACSSMRCSSWGYKYATCDAPGPVMTLSVKNKESHSPCTPKTSYGKLGEKIWVDKGCRAIFQVCVATPPPQSPHSSGCSSMRCSSWGYKHATCNAEGPVMSLAVETKESRSACTLGHSFGISGDKIWVDHGCRAVFKVCVSKNS